MQTAFMIIASIAVIIVTISFVILVNGILREIKKIGKASEDISELTDSLENEIIPAIKDIRSTVINTDILVKNTTHTIDRIDKLSESIDHLIHSAYITTTAAKALKSSTASIISVYEGFRKGIKTLHDSKKPEGGIHNE